MLPPLSRRTSRTLTVILLFCFANILAVGSYIAYRLKQAPNVRELTVTPSSVRDTETAPAERIARAHRAAGMSELETGNYVTAISHFEKAKATGAATADVDKLLQIARDLQSTHPGQKADDTPTEHLAQPETVVTPPAPTPAPAKADTKLSAREREKERERERDRERQRKAATAAANAAAAKAKEAESDSGTIIIGSNPSGLSVQLDGRIIDTTPTRVAASAGEHTIVLLKGSEAVFERRINVVPNGIGTVDADVTERVAALSRPAPAPVPQPTPPPAQPAPPAPADNARKYNATALYLVASKASGVGSASRDEVAALYLGRAKTVGGKHVDALMRGGEAAGAFYSRVLEMSSREYRDVWQKNEFSGRGIAPRSVASITDLATVLRRSPGAVSYALGSELTDITDLTVIPIR